MLALPWRRVLLLTCLALFPTASLLGQGERVPLDSLAARALADSNDPVAHYELGRALLDAGRFDDAERSLRAALALAPQYADAWLALAVLPDRRGEKYWKGVRKARGDTALANAAHESEACYRRAFLADPLVDPRILPRAEEKVSIRVNGYSYVIWWRLPLSRAFNELREGKYQDAIDRLDKLVSDDRAGKDGIWAPDAAYWYRAIAAAHLQRYDAAVDDFWRLVQRSLRVEQADPEDAVPMRTNEYRYFLATMLYLDHRYPDAIKVFQRTLEFDAGLFQSHLQLARMYQDLGRLDDALAERRAAIAVNPDDDGLLIDLAGTLLVMHREQDALEPLHQAGALAPRDPRAPYLEGLVDLSLGDSAAARSAWTRFLALAPSRYARQIAEVRQQFADLHSTP